MEWYYAVEGTSKGPVSPAEFQRLVQQGVITSQTRVWREGMADWQMYAGETAAAPAVAASASPINVTCAGCGGSFPQTEVIPLAGRVYCAACKPAAVQRLREGVGANSAAEAIRNEYLKHEASVQSVGSLYCLGGIVLFIMGLVAMLGGGGRSGGTSALAGLFFFGLGVGQFWVGRGLRKLKAWARIPTGILSGLGLLGIPCGTIINAYILYLVFCRKGTMVFSDEYHDVIEQTPHIKYRTSILVWILLGLVVALVALAFLAVLMRKG
jgi:hypothetical protein